MKTGRGAMMKELERSRSLAKKLVDVGKSFGMDVTALVTNMDTPLGYAIGNALEVVEAIQTLRNQEGLPSDLLELTSFTGGHLLFSSGKSSSVAAGQEKILEAIRDLSALQKFQEMLCAQGVDPLVAQEICTGDMWQHLPRGTKITEIVSHESGFIADVDPLEVARVCHSLGCGRNAPGEDVLLEPGVILKKKLGDMVRKGDVLMEVHQGAILADNELHLNRLRNAVKITTEMNASQGQLIIEIH